MSWLIPVNKMEDKLEKKSASLELWESTNFVDSWNSMSLVPIFYQSIFFIWQSVFKQLGHQFVKDALDFNYTFWTLFAKLVEQSKDCKEKQGFYTKETWRKRVLIKNNFISIKGLSKIAHPELSIPVSSCSDSSGVCNSSWCLPQLLLS